MAAPEEGAGAGLGTVEPRPATPADARRLSAHPEAVKARRWRAGKAAERRGAVLVSLVVEPREVAGLRRLGLVAGRPYAFDQAVTPAEVEAALRQLLAATGPLAELARALAPGATKRA